jgi:hypothetical protein
MQSKLTLRLDDQLIAAAKRYAHSTDRSVSQLVADYFALLEQQQDVGGTTASPRVRSLIGALRGAEVGENDYRSHLERKHS